MKFNTVCYTLLVLFFLLTTGCSTRSVQTVTNHTATLTEDHTLGIVATPVSGTYRLLWRVKTFTTEALNRFIIKYLEFPVMNQFKTKEIDPNRPYMEKNLMDNWLDQRIGKAKNADISIYLGGESFFPVIENRIKNAISNIKINTYIFDNDTYAKHFADVLKDKSSDVPTQVMSDMMGSTAAWSISEEIGEKAIDQSYSSIFDYLRDSSNIQFKRGRNQWLASDHTKTFIIDYNTVFFGGMNIGNEYRYKWRDVMFEVTGEIASDFNKIFDEGWARADLFSDFAYFIKMFQEPEEELIKPNLSGSIKSHLLRTTPTKREIYNAQIKAAENATHHIYIENPYIWNERFIFTLCMARKRGVDVRITMPSESDLTGLKGINRKVINTLIEHDIKIYSYPGMTHVKAAVYDNWACFGTANYDDLSLHKNYEINLGTSDPVFVKRLEEEILLDGQRKSEELNISIDLDMTDNLTHSVKHLF